ncbi:major capsid protein [uncultured Desulfovibrio sp.]|uniref:major capsid protein n=1 Tax=uncultured Desulfovibrio sp. TaxID=167968 RepID=UPI0028055AE4|nr:major capsid protein [uncultured Desulfovibrio sp.]
MRKRSKFSLSYYKLLTCRMGYIIPCGFLEVLPGDSIRMASSCFMRLAPMLAPVMHPCHVTFHHWYVPTRLVFPLWEDFITGGPDGLDVTELPTITPPTGGFDVGSLADYLGLPTKMDIGPISALPFRAYALIYNEWYRDQDLETPLEISTDPGPDTTTSTKLMRGDWERDIFTTARPWPQKGPGVTVPVNGSSTAGNVVSDGKPFTFSTIGSPETSGWGVARPSGSDNVYRIQTLPGFGNPGDTNTGMIFGKQTGLKLDAAGLGSIDVNQLREALALQRFEEHRSMYGSRYTEYLRYLGVRSSDARLQRPEYLGGGKQTIQFSEVLQTAEGTDPVGTLRGHGIAAMRSNRFRYFCEEHGMILTFLMIRPKAIYAQGIDRFWLKKVKEDFWQKELQHIGQQEVYTKELYGAASADSVFGFQNRYDEYRQHWSSISGEFRTILDYWHMARIFANEPVLNADFISSVPTERIFAAQQNDQLYCMVNHSIQARRLMAKFGNPI